MGVSGFGPAPHANPDEYERRLRKGMMMRCPDGAPSDAPRRAASSNRPPQPVPSLPAPVGTGAESIDLSLSLQIADETSIVDAEDQHALDVEDFRRWWRQRLAQEFDARPSWWAETDAYGDRIRRDRPDRFHSRV